MVVLGLVERKPKAAAVGGLERRWQWERWSTERTCWHECLGVSAGLGPGPRLRLRRAEAPDGWEAGKGLSRIGCGAKRP